MKRKIAVISRNSPLSLLQVEETERLLKAAGVEMDLNVITTESYGDMHKELSLMHPALPSDFFTRELDAALLDGTADVAVHSAKDLPYPLPAGIEVIALTAAGDKSDSLVARDGLTLATLPAGSKVGTSSSQRKAELLQLRSDLTVVPIRGTIGERVKQVEDGKVDALIVATCALKRLGIERLATERLPFVTHPLQGNLAVTAAVTVSDEIREAFARIDIRHRYRTVKLVGFGPGDPELITVKGQKALENAAAIYYDDLTNEQFLSQFRGRKVYVGKRSGRHSHHQDDINELLFRAAIEPFGDKAEDPTQPIVRLKGGDPMLFSHGREEIDYLKQRMVNVEVIPGVSSGNALASLTQIPLTHRGIARSAAFVLGHAKIPQNPDADTLLYYMGGSNISNIAQILLASGRAPETPVALVSNVSLPSQRILISTLAELKWAVYKQTPVLMVVGNVVEFAANNRLQQVYYTGTTPPEQRQPYDKVIFAPLIKIVDSDAEQPDTDGYDWVIFTSRYGVRHYRQEIKNVKVASVGPVTSAELRKRGIEPDFESPTESAEGIISFFAGQPESRILLPRSDKGLRALTEGLRQHEVTDLPVYRNIPNAEATAQNLAAVDKIVFTSPSTVEAFRALYPDADLTDKLLVAKGKTTFGELVREKE